MEEKKTPLSDSLIKAASWAHNSSVNKLSYTPLQLVTGKGVTLPGLTTGNEGTESMTNCEAVQQTMERLNNTVSEFREAGMKNKLKECQGLRIQQYQHFGRYLEGDRVWYQPMQGNSWISPVAVLCQRGKSFRLHTNGDVKKVATCKVKLYELVDRNAIREN